MLVTWKAACGQCKLDPALLSPTRTRNGRVALSWCCFLLSGVGFSPDGRVAPLWCCFLAWVLFLLLLPSFALSSCPRRYGPLDRTVFHDLPRSLLPRSRWQHESSAVTASPWKLSSECVRPSQNVTVTMWHNHKCSSSASVSILIYRLNTRTP